METIKCIKQKIKSLIFTSGLIITSFLLQGSDQSNSGSSGTNILLIILGLVFIIGLYYILKIILSYILMSIVIALVGGAIGGLIGFGLIYMGWITDKVTFFWIAGIPAGIGGLCGLIGAIRVTGYFAKAPLASSIIKETINMATDVKAINLENAERERRTALLNGQSALKYSDDVNELENCTYELDRTKRKLEEARGNMN